MIAVIAIDAQFGAQSNIDQVERAFYQGVAGAVETAQPLDLVESCKASVERMATANKLALSAITLIVVNDSPEAKAQLHTGLGHVFNACSVVSTLAQALKVSQLLLKQNKTVALVGVNQLAELATQKSQSTTPATISFDLTFDAYQAVEGVASVLLTSKDQVGDAYVYSWIKGFDSSFDNSFDSSFDNSFDSSFDNSFDSNSDIVTATQAALSQAGVEREQVTMLEVSALADAALAQAERSGLIAAYATGESLHTAIGAARSVTGEGAGFSQVAGLLKCVVSLHQRYIAPLSGWQKTTDDWQNSPFYFPTEARPCFPSKSGQAHIAAYSCQTADSYCHLILQEDSNKAVRQNGFIACSELNLCLLAGDNEADLLAQLTVIDEQIDSKGVAAIAYHCYEQFKDRPNAPYRLSLIAQSDKELRREIKLAKMGIVKTFADVANAVQSSEENRSGEWETPKGSYFNAKPVNADANGNKGNIAFIYPGIGATYLGLGRDLFHLFPQIYQPVVNLADDIAETLKDTRLNPRSINRLSVKELTQLDLELRYDLANIAECGVGFACVFTKVFEEVFAVKADLATGYSMGEVSMYAALGCWQQPGLLSARLAQSDTFNSRLCGELETLKVHWQLDEAKAAGKLWETYTVKSTIDKVSIALEGENRVYCTIINTPDSLLLGGYPADCERVIAKNGWWAMPLQMANAIHSEPAQLEYDHMVELHTMAVTERIETKMYSSSCYLPIPQRTKAIAHSVAKCLCDPVDYPRLINTLYDQGARVFIEMGPGRSLCRWVGRILDYESAHEGVERPYATVPVNAKGTSDELTTIRALAKLASHGVKLDLDSVFNGSIVVNRR